MRPAMLLAIAIVAGCHRASEENQTTRSAADEIGSSDGAPRIAPTPNSIEAEGTGVQENDAVSLASEERWIGRFAATTELCRGGAWDIRATQIVTDAGTTCDIDRVGRSAQQVTLRMSCSAEGTKTNEQWVFSPEGAEGIKLRRRTDRDQIDVNLIRCS